MKNIVLIGMPGCGKSVVGQKLAILLNREFYDIDKIIESEQRRRIPNIFAEDGEAFFRALESESIRRLSFLSNTVISTGGGAVLSAENIHNLKNNGIIVFIDRPIDNIAGDIDMKNRPLLAFGEAALRELFENRLPVYVKAADIRVKNNMTVDDLICKIVQEVRFFENTCS